MTQDKQAIDGLIAAVEDGLELPRPLPFQVYQCAYIIGAYEGSLDAAKALHDELLPGWHFAILDDDAAVSEFLDKGEFSAKSTNPARAWLLAILRAVRSREAK